MLCLRKLLVVIGLIILVIGLIATVEAGTYSRKKTTITSHLEGTKDTDWEISGEFTEGNGLNFSVTPGTDWGMYAEHPAPGDPITFPYTTIFIYIIDPNGGTTNFSYVYAQTGQEQGIHLGLAPFGVNVTSNDGGIDMKDTSVIAQHNHTIYYTGIQGIVKYTGTYKVVVDSAEWPTPPRYLDLYKLRIDVEMPYLFVVPFGGTVTGFGVLLSAWAAKKPRPSAKHRIRKK